MIPTIQFIGGFFFHAAATFGLVRLLMVIDIGD
jgi:hypothetical protein